MIKRRVMARRRERRPPMTVREKKKSQLMYILYDLEAMRQDCRQHIESIRDIMDKVKDLCSLNAEEKMILEELDVQLEDIKETQFLDIDRFDSVIVSIKSICKDKDDNDDEINLGDLLGTNRSTSSLHSKEDDEDDYSADYPF